MIKEISGSHSVTNNDFFIDEFYSRVQQLEILDKKPFSNKKDINTKELEDTLTAHLKFKVNILCDNKKKSGKVNILFNDNQELEKICNILKKSF